MAKRAGSPELTDVKEKEAKRCVGGRITDVHAEIERRIQKLDALPEDPARELALLLCQVMDSSGPGSRSIELMTRLTLQMEEDLQREAQRKRDEERRKLAEQHERETTVLRLQLGVREMDVAQMRREQLDIAEAISDAREALVDSHRNIEWLQAKNHCLMMSDTSHSWRECSICLNGFSEEPERVPRVLKCGHTLCQQCVDRVKGGDYSIQCPIDRKHMFGSIDELQINYQILSNL